MNTDDKRKKAIIVGGSNGIGLSIAKFLLMQDYYVHILDVVPPELSELPCEENWKYSFCDIRCINETQLREISESSNLEILMITAGIGRLAHFSSTDLPEIRKTIEINTIGVLQVIRCFYDRLLRKETLYCGVMGSIAGLVNSPLFSVYAASKAAVCRFIESVNIELEQSGTANRILNVSPGSIKGTRFNGGENNSSQTADLAKQIVNHMLERDELFIPQYDEVFKGVIERYNQDPHEFGMNSYQYKLDSGRINENRRTIIGYLSGTFDLFHVGHLNLLKRAKAQCDYLIVGVHDSGKWKGKETFIPLEERKAIVESCKYVDKVVDSCREDSDAWKQWRFDRLFVGSDYKGTERFNRYEEFFKDKDVKIIYFPYTKGTSSTQLRQKLSKP